MPAPRIATRASESGTFRSASDLRTASSTAADEIETAPLAISVSLRTYFPAITTELSIRPSTLPADPAGSSSLSFAIAWL